MALLTGRTVDTSDVYGLGLFLLHLVAGERLAEKWKLDDVVLPNHAMGRDVKKVLTRCLAPDPCDRFPTARAVVDAIHAIGPPENPMLSQMDN